MVFSKRLVTLFSVLDVLAQREELVSVSAVISQLNAFAERHSTSGTREALAWEALRSVSSPAILDAVAVALLTSVLRDVEAGRTVLVAAGRAGADALCAARTREGLEISRPRFVAIMREIGEDSVVALAAELERFESVDTADRSLVEDLLRCAPDMTDKALGDQIVRFLNHEETTIRRRAVTTLATAWGARAREELSQALSDTDDAVRSAAFAGLGKSGLIDRRVVDVARRLLQEGATCGPELQASAAAALKNTMPEARAASLSVLLATMEPRTKSFVGIVIDLPQMNENALVLETVATVLLTIGGDAGRRAVEKRAATSRGEVKDRLERVLARSPGQ